MNLIVQLLMGLLIGYTARFFLPGHDRWGIIITSLIGVGGAWLGPFIAGKLGVGIDGIKGFVFSVIGAVLILMVLRMV
jgi:uncharacterized membrane protein YeaQ/YmgE (transglycosylase-associated protein family)